MSNFSTLNGSIVGLYLLCYMMAGIMMCLSMLFVGCTGFFFVCRHLIPAF